MAIFKEKYKYLFILLFLFFFNYCCAQKEYNSWVFYDSCSLVFNGNSILVNTIPNTVGLCPAVICDKHTGSLLFTSDGDGVEDKTGNVMPNGFGLKGCETANQAALIVPDPGDDSSYYVFTNDCIHNGGHNGMNYSIVDMRLNGGLGDVTYKNIFVCNNESEKLTAVRACSFDGFWIITYVYSSNDFFAWRLTVNGISVDSPIVSPAYFTGYPANNPAGDGGCLKPSPDGNMLVAGFNHVNTDTDTYLYNFDKTTGNITLFTKVSWSGSPNFNPQGDLGVGFSPDNSKAYFANQYVMVGPTYGLLYQINLKAGTIKDILNSVIQINPTNLYNSDVTGIQIGPDKKIYAINWDFGSLSIISQPDSPATSCNYINDELSLNTYLAYGELPNNIDALYYPDTLFSPNFTYSVNCANNSGAFTDNSNITPKEWWWSFGDIASGSNNHSTLQNPTHQFTSPGTYTVSMWAYEGCAVDSVIKTVTICPVTPSLIIPTLIYGLGSQTQWQIINLPQGSNSVTIYDELGRTLYKTSNYPNNYDMRNLPPAMYFYRLDLQDGEELTGKIIVVR